MKQFFITFFANLAALLFVFGGPMLLLLILFVASLATSTTAKPPLTIERGTVLVLDLSMNVTDSPEHAANSTPFSAALGGNDTRSVTLRSLTTALKKAARDDRIRALYITGSFEPVDFGTGFASLKELREAILDFENTKVHKPVIAYIEGPTAKDYYVASAATTIYMNPFGEMEIPGLASVKTYYADLFKNYGINVQVTRVGKYKSAVEPFILDKMSDADREETETLLNDIWGTFLSSVSSTRGISVDDFRKLINTDGYILPEHALAAHLVDKLGYLNDVLAELGKIAPSSSYARIPLPFQQIAISDYINSSRTPRLPGERGSDNVVAILYLEGEIVDGWGDTTNIGGDRFAAELRELQKDPDVKSVVLRVNSPGGSAYASEVILHEIQELKKKKPVIVSMGAYAASGGYWISAYGDRIFAEPNTLTGSIGVFGMFMDYQKLGNNYGVTWDTAKTDTFADFSSNSRPKTDQELAMAQSRVDIIYGKFLDKVSEGRKIPRPELELIAQGRVWAGSEALRLHLIDEIGGLSNAITYAAQQAKLDPNHYRVKEYPQKATFNDILSLLFNSQDEPVTKVTLGDIVDTLFHTEARPVAKAKPDILTQQYLRLESDFKTLQEFNDPVGVYARMPIGWEIR